MTQKQAAVTVTDASGVKDLVVPLGTTVTGLLSMLDIDSSDPSLQITGADGRPLNLGAVLGTDLPQGVLISITSGRERQRQEQRAIERASDPWFRPSLALSICALLAFAMDAVLIFCTLFAQLLTIIAGVPWWAPLTIGVLSLALCLVVLYQNTSTPTPDCYPAGLSLRGFLSLASFPLWEAQESISRPRKSPRCRRSPHFSSPCGEQRALHLGSGSGVPLPSQAHTHSVGAFSRQVRLS